jgi:hypothetical protein
MSSTDDVEDYWERRDPCSPSSPEDELFQDAFGETVEEAINRVPASGEAGLIRLGTLNEILRGSVPREQFYPDEVAQEALSTRTAAIQQREVEQIERESHLRELARALQVLGINANVSESVNVRHSGQLSLSISIQNVPLSGDQPYTISVNPNPVGGLILRVQYE